MTLTEVVVYLVIAGICGAIARAFAGGTRGGFIMSIVLGFVGAVVGMCFARVFRLPTLVSVVIGGHPFPIIWSILGGFVLVAGAHALTRRRSMYWR